MRATKKIIDWPEGATMMSYDAKSEMEWPLVQLVISEFESRGLPPGTVLIEAEVRVSISVLVDLGEESIAEKK